MIKISLFVEEVNKVHAMLKVDYNLLDHLETLD